MNFRKIISRYASLIAIGLILTFSSFLTIRDLHRQQTGLIEKSEVMNNQVQDAIFHEIQKRVDILNLFIQSWKANSEIESLYSMERFESMIPSYYNTTHGFKAINWIDVNGTVQWIFPYEENVAVLNQSIVYLKGDLYNTGFTHAQTNHEMGVMGVFELYQGGYGFTTYIPIFYNSTLTGYLNGVFDLNILFGDILNPEYGFVNIAQYSVKISFNETFIYSNNENFTRDEKYVITKEFSILNSFNLELAIRPIKNVRTSASLSNNWAILAIGCSLAFVVGALIHVLYQRNDLLRISAEEKSKLMQELHIRQKFESLGTLAGGIAHDFNNLLAAILGNIDLFALNLKELDLQSNSDQILLVQEMQGDLQEIEVLIARSGKLINQITQFSSSPSAELKPINFNEIVSDSIKGFHKMIDRRISSHIDLTKKEIYILADESKFNQVLLNLWINARDAIEPNAGEIKMISTIVPKNITPIKPQEVKYSQNDFSQSSIYNPNLELEIQISDTGKGISTEILEKIFDPFFTTKTKSQQGTGLGLTIAFKVIKTMDGTISVKSDLGKGTTFTITLPILDRTYTTKLPFVKEKDDGVTKCYDFQNMMVLIIEDEELVQKSIQKYLEKCQAIVYSANSGYKALKLYYAYPNQFNLIILDVNLPEINGIDLYQKIKTLNPQQATLFITGFSETDLPSLDRHDLGILTKPFELNNLAEKLEHFWMNE